MKEENSLTQFETNKKEYYSLDWFTVLQPLVISAMFFYFGYDYYKMFFINNNAGRMTTAIIYFSVASFNISTFVLNVIIRQYFIRKSDLKSFELKEGSSVKIELL